MLIDYLPIVVMAVLAGVFAVGSLMASGMLRPNRPNPVKLSAYECGNDPVRLPSGERFSVKFYLIAMLFIIFDVEIVFFYPWAVVARELRIFGLVEMLVFVGLLFVAYVYIWKRGGLDWEEDSRLLSRMIRARVMREALLGPGERGLGAPVAAAPEREPQRTPIRQGIGA